MNKKTAVIIVTHNASEYIGDLFSSLKEVDYPKDRYEIVVVDNSSDDDTLEKISNFEFRISNLKIIREKENLGFVGGNNKALRYAIEKGFDYVYLLNQDTIVDRNFLTEAIRTAEGDASIGVVQSLLLLHPEKERINSWGNEVHFLGFAYSGGYREKIQNSKHEIRNGKEIAYASGAACLIRISALKRTGLLNEAFFMYHEDVDLGWKMWLMSYRVVLSPESRVFHKYEFSRSMKKYYYMERNRILTLLENYSTKTLCIITPFCVGAEILIFLLSLFGGYWREKLRAYAYFLSFSNWKKILAVRKKIQHRRIMPDRFVIKHFTGVINFQETRGFLTNYFFNPVSKAVFSVIKKWV